MPLTKPYLDMISPDEALLETAKSGDLVQYDKKFTTTQREVKTTYARISNITYDVQQGVLTMIFDNGKTLKAQGFLNTFKIGAGKQGEQGDPGLPGRDGRDGLDGQKGITGCEGEVGPEGNRGDKGPIGDTGQKGLTGDAGPTGDIGFRGIQGDRGEIGPRGERGFRGRDGKDGYVNLIISHEDPGASLGALSVWVVPSHLNDT